MTNVDSILKSRDIYFANSVLSCKLWFSSSHIWMWQLDCKESWAPKNWCFWPVLLEKTLEPPFGCKEIQPVHPKGNQSCVFIGRTELKLKLQYFATWCKELTHWKRPWCLEILKVGGEGDGRGWVGWMPSLTRWTWVWVNSGSWWWTGSLACCSPWVAKSRTQLSNLIDLMICNVLSIL